MQRASYRPLTSGELAHELKLASDALNEFKGLLGKLEKEGQIARIRKDRFILPKEADLHTGQITFHPKGFAFLAREGEEDDLFIPPEDTGTAMHGDRVVARLNRPSPRSFDRPTAPGRSTARVVRILERARETMVGTLQQTRKFFYVVADDPRFPHNIYVGPEGIGLPRKPRVGDKVVVRLFPWESRHVNPEGELVELLGAGGDPGVDMISIIRKHNLPTEFPQNVTDEADRIPDTVHPEDHAGRSDCRDHMVFTIDPDDARDFDDAVRVERTGDGWRLTVHIADVSHYVQSGGALDREAFQRGNSVYLVDRVLPMLPERLSNGICSLRPEVERLAFSAILDFARDGSPRHARFDRSVIRSAARLTYREALAILEKKRATTPLEEAVHTGWELASVLRKRRFAHGSLDLDFPELKVHLDERGKPVRLERVENDISHQLVEEFMLAANEAVAKVLRDKLRPSLYRIHEDPDPKRLNEFREFALSHGFKPGDLSKRQSLQRLLEEVSGTPEEQGVKINLLKSLQKARYDPKPIGHYGLAKSNYTHFTSPIRRYADLVVHRVLGRLIEDSSKQSPVPASTDLTSVARHVSDTERVAAEAERESVSLKKLEFFEAQSANGTAFPARVIDVRNFGLMLELPDFLIGGVIHISALEDDFYVFDPVNLQLRGRRNRKIFRVGDTVKVRVARVDRFKREVDFAPAH